MQHPNPHMQLALTRAHEAAAAGEVPVGAVIVRADGTLLSARRNETMQRHDPTAHAELLAIREACEKTHNMRLDECDLYVTLEPCPMCAAAISFARIRRLYFGAQDPKGGGVEHGARVFSHATCHWRPEVIGGIRESECAEVMRAFFQERR